MNTDDTPRIALSFGFLVPSEKVTDLYKPPSPTTLSSLRLLYEHVMRTYKEYRGLFNGRNAVKHLYGENHPLNENPTLRFGNTPPRLR
jgi:hypothetical protein